jgi:hypothetical protein
LHPVSDILRGFECCNWSAVRLDSKCHLHALQCELRIHCSWLENIICSIGNLLTRM